MTPMSDQEIAQTEGLLRQRLAQLADHAPTAVHLPGEVAVVSSSRPARRGRRAGAITAVAALIGAGGFTTYSLLGASNDGGAATPEEAVSSFVSAVQHEDVLGMIDVTLPEEVGELRSTVESVTSDATRVGLISDDFDARDVHGVDVSIAGLQLRTDFLEGGLATVTATAGTVTATFDPQRFPFGDRLRALLGDLNHTGTASSTFGHGDPVGLLMTVERDGRWYVSLEYTLAEYVRRAAGWDVPGAVLRTPVGFDSPELAVSGFYDHLAALDLPGAFDTFAPGEDAMSWLAQSWMADARSAIDRARTTGWTVALSKLTYETSGSGDHLTLKPLTFEIAGTVPAGFGEGSSSNAEPSPSTAPKPFTIERTNGCTTFTGGIAELFASAPDMVGSSADGTHRECGTDDGLGVAGFVTVTNLATQLPPVAVVQSGGKWYVSPLGTLLASVSSSLHDMKDGASLFDSSLAPFLYGGLSRSSLQSAVEGMDVAAIDAACLPALTVVDGKATGVVLDPPIAAIRACSSVAFGFESSSTGSSSSGSGIAVATPEPAVASTTP
jgi:hypothetical protein